MKTLFVYLGLLVALPSFAVDRDPETSQRCAMALGEHPELAAAMEIAQARTVNSREFEEVIAIFAQFSKAHPKSLALVDTLAMGETYRHIHWDEHWDREDRLAMITNHLVAAGDEVAIARYADLVWERVMNLIGPEPDPRALTPDAESLFALLTKSAQEYPEIFAKTWNAHVWGDERSNSPLWNASRFASLIDTSAETFSRPRFKRSKGDQEISAFLRALKHNLDSFTKSDRLSGLLQHALPDLAVLNGKSRAYEEKLNEITYSSEDTGRLWGAPNVLLQFRVMRSLKRVLPPSVRFPNYEKLESKFEAWSAREKADKVGLEDYVDPSLKLARDQDPVVRAMGNDLLFKKKIFEKAILDLEPVARQSWETVINPDEVRAKVEALDVHSPEYAQFSLEIRDLLGKDVADLQSEDLYRYYADEIWNALPPQAKGSSAPTTFRYVRRNLSDLRTTEKMGVCSKLAGLRYGPVLTCYSNAAYQIVIVKRGKRDMLMIGLALMKINGRPTIFIDSFQVHPQAITPDLPLFEEGYAAFRDSMGFLTDLATKMKRDLMVFTSSNATWANESLASFELFSDHNSFEQTRVATGNYLYDASNVRRILNLDDNVTLRPFYQLLVSDTDRQPDFKTGKVTHDPNLRGFEEIFTRASALDETLAPLAEKLRTVKTGAERETVASEIAKRLLSQSQLMKEMGALYQIPESYGGVGRAFLIKKLDLLFPTRGEGSAEYSSGFIIRPEVYRIHAQ